MFIQPGICVSACPAISSPRFIGSFTIKRQINEVTFLLQLPARYRIHRVHSTCHSSSPSVQGTEEPAAPPPPEVQAEPLIKSTISAPPKHSLSGLKHSMCYLPDSPTFVYLLVVPVSRSLCSCSCVPSSPRSYSHWILWKRKQDLLRSGKTLLNIAIPCTLTWTLHLASLHCHYSINLLLFALTSVSLVYLRTNWDLL